MKTTLLAKRIVAIASEQEFDGASRRNPGRASYGFAILEDSTNLLVRFLLSPV